MRIPTPTKLIICNVTSFDDVEIEPGNPAEFTCQYVRQMR